MQGRGLGRADGRACGLKKKSWGALTKSWVPHDTRDEVVDFLRRCSQKAEIGVGKFITWLGIGSSKFYPWQQRYGRVNEHNAWIPRDFWLQPWEKEAIIQYHHEHPLKGYRRLTGQAGGCSRSTESASVAYKLARQLRQLRRQQASAAAANRVTMPVPGETEAGSVGTQPC